MGKIIFFNIPAHGHTNPTLPVVRELTDRGETVIYYSFPEYREKIEASGAEYRPCLGFPDVQDFPLLVSRMSYLYEYLLFATSVVLDEMVGIVKRERPDGIIHDSLCVWGKYAAEICGVPAISSSSTFVFTAGSISLKMVLSLLVRFNPFLDLKPLLAARKHHRHINRKYGIKKGSFATNLSNLGQMTLVYTSRELQPGGMNLDVNRFRFVGPSIAARENDPDTDDYSRYPKPLVYISLGTILNENKSFYASCFKAFETFHGHVVISTGKSGAAESCGDIPPHFTLKSHVNQLEILKQADAFVSHGGMNSVHESLYHGVPLCVYPFHVEQASVADRVLTTGCGLILKSIRPAAIRHSVDTLLENPRYREGCRRMGATLREAGGYRKAVDYIIGFLKGD
jgi:MGT family glycosyltransferase